MCSVTGSTHAEIYTVLTKVAYQDVSHYNHAHTQKRLVLSGGQMPQLGCTLLYLDDYVT